MSEDTTQLSAADLSGMSAEEISQATRAGRLNELLGWPAPPPRRP
jgi:hypothetical protein